MTQALVEQLLRLTGRERALLLIMAVVLVAGAAAGLLWPLEDRRKTAEAALVEARALEHWAQARVADLQVLRSPKVPGTTTPIGLAAVQGSLESAGLIGQVTTLSAQRGDGIEIRFEAVNFDKLIAWVAQAEPAWGYRFSGFRIERGREEGLVDAYLDIVPQTNAER